MSYFAFRYLICPPPKIGFQLTWKCLYGALFFSEETQISLDCRKNDFSLIIFYSAKSVKIHMIYFVGTYSLLPTASNKK